MELLGKAWNWAIHIPWTIWDRSQGVPEQSKAGIKKWRYRFTLAPVPFNPIGASHVEYNQTFEAAGYLINLESASYSGGTLQLNIKVLRVPAGGQAIEVVPIAAIIVGIGAIIGGVIVIALLTKVEAILSLPIIPIILIFAIFVMVWPTLRQQIKKGG